MRRSAVRLGLAANGIVLLAVFVVHWPDLSGYLSSNPIYLVPGLVLQWSGNFLAGVPGWVDWHAGATHQALGSLAAWDWLHKVIPWWDSYVGVGLPLGAQPQSSAFFLPFILLEHFFDGTMYLKIAMQVIAGQATYLLLRRLGFFRMTAVTGAILYELGGMFAWFADAPIMPLPFLPLCVLGVENALAAARGGRRGGWCLVSVSICYLVLGGFPETAYLCGLLALAWSILRFAAAGRVRWRFAGKVALGGTVGLMIASPMLLAFIEYLAQAWPQPRYTDHDHLLGSNYAMYLFPYLFGPLQYGRQYDLWSRMGGYVGLAPCFLACASLAGGGRLSALKWLLALWVIISMAKSASVPGVTDILNMLPGVSQVMFYRYIAPTISFAVAILSSLALDDWRRDRWRRPGWVVVGAGACTLLISAGALALAGNTIALLSAHRDYLWYPAASVLVPVLFVTAVACILARKSSSKAALVCCVIAAGESAILFTTALLSGAQQRGFDSAPVAFLQKNIGLNRFFSIGPISPNYGSYFRVASINHNYLPLAERWQEYVTGSLDPGAVPNVFNGTTPKARDRLTALRDRVDAYEQIGVKYVVVYKWNHLFAAVAQPAPQEVFRDALTSIYELPHPSPYFEAGDAGCTVRDEGRQLVHGHCKAATRLTRRELYFPGWSATVNGQAAAVMPTGPIFQAVDVPAGDFTVQFRYAPPHIAYAYAACVAGIVLLALGIATGQGHATLRLSPRQPG